MFVSCILFPVRTTMTQAGWVILSDLR